jgi:polyribonucleotide nucleotidyltransferase
MKENIMFNEITKSIQWGEETLSFTTGKVARQAGGSIVARMGGTTVLCVATAAKSTKEGVDFFPLTCVYQEKAFAAGKIPGGFFKREARPSEHETLTSRLIDRPVRPLFDSNFKNETQVICTVLEFDGVNYPDMVAMCGAAAALAVSGLPFNGPMAATRVAYINDEYVLNPMCGYQDDTKLDLIVAGTKDSVMMVESEVSELSEEIMLGAVEFAHKNIQPVITLIEELQAEAGKPRWEVAVKDQSELEGKVKDLAEADLRAAYDLQDKQERSTRLNEIRSDVTSKIAAAYADSDSAPSGNEVSGALKHLEQEVVRGDLLRTKKRIDGRATDKVRDIDSQVGILPRTHGSALFTRGETQALVVATLGTGQDEQRGNSLEGDTSDSFMLHYNFPPYSVGEVQFLRGPGRREIGHGKLAWRAINAMLPNKDDFPYTIRVVSEITESNGSSSMATVCGTSLALMDAGVPLERPVAGIAMGLVLEGDDYVVLSDILGDEDHLGDMDFKVAGTSEGITSLQMDIKIEGITIAIMKEALAQAKDGREYILAEMDKALTGARTEVNEFAPKITTIKVHTDKIREIIGTGGKVIREICETSGATVDIEEDGTVRIAAVNAESGKIAEDMINNIVAEAEVGAIYKDCEVKKVVDFGAFVSVVGSKDGLVHISELANKRVDAVTDVINEGDRVAVKVLAIDRQGKIKLSMKCIDQATGEEIAQEEKKAS